MLTETSVYFLHEIGIEFDIVHILIYFCSRLNHNNNNRLYSDDPLNGLGHTDFPDNAVFNNLLSTNRSVFKCITLEAINIYFTKRNAESNRSKVRNLDLNMMLNRIGVHQSGFETYIQFSCHAEESKRVLYIGKIHFNNDFGITCSNCSCPEGVVGP